MNNGMGENSYSQYQIRMITLGFWHPNGSVKDSVKSQLVETSMNGGQEIKCNVDLLQRRPTLQN